MEISFIHMQTLVHKRVSQSYAEHTSAAPKRGLASLVPISLLEPANFLRRMLDKNEGSGKDQFLGDPDWLSEMQYNAISPLFADY